MLEWIGEYWPLLIAGVAGFGAYTFRPPRARDENRSLAQRLFYTLFPEHDPEREIYKRRPIQFKLLGIGLVILFGSLGLVEFWEWYRLR